MVVDNRLKLINPLALPPNINVTISIASLILGHVRLSFEMNRHPLPNEVTLIHGEYLFGSITIFFNVFNIAGNSSAVKASEPTGSPVNIILRSCC
jgi:hypothetical protein